MASCKIDEIPQGGHCLSLGYQTEREAPDTSGAFLYFVRKMEKRSSYAVWGLPFKFIKASMTFGIWHTNE